MTLEFYYHPLSSFCHKALIALYENDTPFEPRFVDFGDEKSSADFKALWPMGKMPVLRDTARDCVVPETSIIIEYLAQYYPGSVPLVSNDPELGRRIRAADRFLDTYIHVPMQKMVGDHLRPADKKDPYGAEQARLSILAAYAILEKDLDGKTFLIDERLTLADCAAAPALFYADKVVPFKSNFPNIAAYFERLLARSSYARVLKEAEPYFHMFPVK